MMLGNRDMFVGSLMHFSINGSRFEIEKVYNHSRILNVQIPAHLTCIHRVPSIQSQSPQRWSSDLTSRKDDEALPFTPSFTPRCCNANDEVTSGRSLVGHKFSMDNSCAWKVGD